MDYFLPGYNCSLNWTSIGTKNWWVINEKLISQAIHKIKAGKGASPSAIVIVMIHQSTL